MILQKRIHKPPQEFICPIVVPWKQKKIIPKKCKKLKDNRPRCDYQLIPSPSKYSFGSKTYLLCGDVVLRKEDESFTSDLCLFNKFKRYKDVFVKSIKSHTVVEMNLEGLCHINLNQQDDNQEFIKELEGSDNPSLREWSKYISSYESSLESLYQEQVQNKTQKSAKEKKMESETRKKAERKIVRLLGKYPCVYLKRRFTDDKQNLQLVQISFSETFLSILGYSTESFISITLKEGIPPIQKAATLDYRSVLEFMTGHLSHQSHLNSRPLQFESSLMLKCGYVRDVVCKAHFIPNYEDGLFGLDVITAVTSKDTPRLNHFGLNYKINQDFLKSALFEDEEASKFSDAYYQLKKHHTYKYMNKLCKVKEIDKSYYENFEEESEAIIKTETFCKEEDYFKQEFEEMD